MNKPAPHRAPYRFFAVHGIIVALAYVLAKVDKAFRMAPEAELLSVVRVSAPDVLTVAGLELWVFALLVGAPAIVRRPIALVWGLTLFPLVTFCAFEHRFFLSSGSQLDLPLLITGLRQARDLMGIASAELTPIWWFLLIAPVPLALVVSTAAWRSVRDLRRSGRQSVVALVSGSLLLLPLFAWSIPQPNKVVTDVLVTLRSNVLVTMLIDGIAVNQTLEDDDGLNTEPANIPDAVALSAGPSATPMNIVIFILESVRADATTPYVPSLNTTPFLQKMADEGLKVEEAYTVIPHTTKSLVPILCGVEPDIRQALSEVVPRAIPAPCLPTLLQPLGYASAFFQPAMSRFEQRKQLVDNAGFQKFVAREQLPKKKWQSPNYFGLEDRAAVGPMLEWVDKQKSPFMLTFLTLVTHHDYKVPSTFKKEEYGVSERWSDYLNTIRYSDEVLREIFEGFVTRGLEKNTLFVFIGDHGEGHGEHGKKGHDEIIYEEGIRVPLILWNPTLIPRPMIVEGLRQNIDILPTIVKLLNFSITEGSFRGQNLLEDVTGRTLFSACWYEDRCISRRRGSQKINFYYGRKPIEIFDLKADPSERKNLVANFSETELVPIIHDMKDWKRSQRKLYASHRVRNSEGLVLLTKPVVQQTFDATFNNKIHAFGIEFDGKAKVDSWKTITMYFEVKKNMGWNSAFQFEFEDAGARRHKVQSRTSESRYGLFTWVPGQFMRFKLEVKLPRSTAEGSGNLMISVGTKKKKVDVSGENVRRSEKAALIPILVEK